MFLNSLRIGTVHINRLSLTIAIATSIIVAFMSLQPRPVYDDGLYHFQIVDWYSQYPVVPGLANVHSRFGFNSGYYLYAALLQVLPGEAIQYALPILIVAFAGYLGEQRGTNRWLMLWMTIPLLAFINGISLSNDVPIIIGISVLLSEGWRIYFQQEQRVIWFAILASAVIAVKLSALVFCTVLLLLCLYAARQSRLQILSVFTIALFVVGLHGLILSGYPLYPLPWLVLPVDWAVPNETATLEMQWVTSWARWPRATFDETLYSNVWLNQWVGRFLLSPIAVTGLVVWVIGLLTSLILRIRTTRWHFLFPALLGLLYWWVSAPDIRFGLPILWVGVAVTMVIVMSRVVWVGQLLYSAFLLSFGTLYFLIYLQTSAPVRNDIELVTHKSAGIEVYVPATGDQCWDAPLPCAPSRPNIILRESSLASGFRALAENTSE